MDFGWLGYLWIIPVLGVLVFVHELGHFVTARLNGIRVDEFGFGFPPRLFGVKRGDVIYSINAIPVGGFVRIYGENGEGVGEPNSFGAKAPWRRAVVLAAGSFMNVVLAFVIFSLLAVVGLPTAHGAQIGGVEPNSPAAVAGLQKGDKIRSIAGVKIDSPADVAGAVEPSQGKETVLVLDRDGREVRVSLTPRKDPPKNKGAIGIRIEGERIVKQRYNPIVAIGIGAEQTFSAIVIMVTGVAALISGAIGFSGLAGPLGIAQATNQVAKQGQFELLLNWTALLSLNLFLVNMLPLPALDGGRLVFVVLEAIRRKKIAPQREAFVHAIGMMLLLMFLVVISFFDVQRILGGTSILP